MKTFPNVKSIAFASQKGGVGKSTISEIVSSILHYEKGYNVLVIDLDEKQNSFHELRKRDLNTLERDENLSVDLLKYYETIDKKPFPIVTSNGKNIEGLLTHQLGKYPHTDIVIFDMPGRADDVRLIKLLVEMDSIIFPIEPDIQSLTSSIAYIKAVTTLRKEGNALVLWNKVHKNPQTEVIMKFYQDVIKRMGFEAFSTYIPYSSKYSRELAMKYNGVFRCSFMPPDKDLRRRTTIDLLMKEIEEKILHKND